MTPCSNNQRPETMKSKSDTRQSSDAKKRSPSLHRDGTQSLYVIPDQDGSAEGLPSPCGPSAQGQGPKVSRRFSDLDIPFIDDDV